MEEIPPQLPWMLLRLTIQPNDMPNTTSKKTAKVARKVTIISLQNHRA